MIERLTHQPRFPRPSISFDPRAVQRAGRRLLGWRPPRDIDARLLLYRIAWAPFWVASDIPAPRLPVKELPHPNGGPAGDRFAHELDRLVRRLWLQRAFSVIARVLWLPLLIGCLWLLIELAGGPAWDPWVTVAIGIVLVPPALVFAWLARPSRRAVAICLDRSFQLQERMLTALEDIGRDVMRPGESPTVTYLQLADAANVIIELRGHAVFKARVPVRELVLATFFALLLASLYFVRGVGGGIPPLSTDSVPAFVPAAERMAEEARAAAQPVAPAAEALTPDEVRAMAERSNQTQQDLKKLGDALADQAVTRAAADAIARGDYEAAADLIREAGERADSLSAGAREGLADDLDQAAAEMSADSEALADAAREAAQGLREGGEAANQGMQELGDAVDEAASSIVSQRELADQMSRAQAAESSGSSGSSGEPGDPSAGEPSDQQSGSEQSSSADGSTSGANGADAEPGSSDGTEPGEEAGGNSTGGDQAGNQAGDSQQPGEAPGQGAEGQGAEGEEPGAGGESGQSEPNAAGEGSDLGDLGEGENPGSGAGTGDQNGEPPAGQQGGQRGDQTGEPGSEPSDPNVTEANSGAGQATGPEEDPRTAITLNRSPDEGGIQTSSADTTSSDNGANAVNADGDQVQGEVGEAGPDSNHVPAEYRGLVEAYFTNGDD